MHFYRTQKKNAILAVILNWNETDITRRCVKSLVTQKDSTVDILIVDNNSTEDPTNILLSEFLTIKLIINNENLGVPGGRNVGIHYAIEHGYEFILFFDNDAYADKNMVKKLMDSAKRNPSAGILGPKIFCENPSDIIWRAGCTSWKWTYLHAGFEISNFFYKFFKIIPPSFLDTKRGEGQKDLPRYNIEKQIRFQIGCCQLIRMKTFLKVGIMDEDFSLYGSEDIDFCDRMMRAGFKIMYIPEAICWHRVTSSFNDDYSRTFNNNKNIILLARKNLSFLYFWSLFIPDYILLTIPLIILKYIIQRKYKSIKGFLNAIVWNIKDVRKRGIFLWDRDSLKV